MNFILLYLLATEQDKPEMNFKTVIILSLFCLIGILAIGLVIGLLDMIARNLITV